MSKFYTEENMIYVYEHINGIVKITLQSLDKANELINDVQNVKNDAITLLEKKFFNSKKEFIDMKCKILMLKKMKLKNLHLMIGLSLTMLM